MSKKIEMIDKAESTSGGQVISRAATILRALAEDSSGQSLGKIAKKVDLPRTTVHRIVTALEVQQLVVTTPTGVRLGPALVKMASSVHTDVISASRPFIELLSRRLRETVDLCVDRFQHAVSVDQFASDQELRVVSAIGTAYPIHCTAHGKALLSLRTDSEIMSLLDNKLEKRTERTIIDKNELIEQISEVRLRGWAFDREEHAVGICGIGVPLITSGLDRYALSVAIPAARFDENIETYLSVIFQCKAEIEALLAG